MESVVCALITKEGYVNVAAESIDGLTDVHLQPPTNTVRRIPNPCLSCTHNGSSCSPVITINQLFSTKCIQAVWSGSPEEAKKVFEEP